MDKGEGPLPQFLTEEFDAVVVGAGPAGCMAARRIASHMRVLLIDSSPLPRSKPCGGALNPYSWSFLRDFSPPSRLFLDPEEVSFRWLDFDSGVSRVTRLEFKNVSREAFDEWVLSLVPLSVSVRAETRFLGFEERGKELVVTLDSPEGPLKVGTRYLIGADGPLSPVRRSLLGSDTPTYACIQDWVERTNSVHPYFDCIRMKDVGKGHAYTYTVPKGDAVLVGSVFYPGATGQKGTHDAVLGRLSERVEFGKRLKRESAAALQVRSRKDIFLGRGNVLLAGEAAGFISPTSGEGISYALTTGDTCGRAIASNGHGGLAGYERLIEPAVKNISRKARKLALLEYRLGHAILAGMPLSVLSWMTKRL
ncbi:MAG: hypothetical protein C4521_07200 [Actinobacteria bacterium]|nr:MAG: hypothetical protein C4521_07200 [Actinomycetota bacterium]